MDSLNYSRHKTKRDDAGRGVRAREGRKEERHCMAWQHAGPCGGLGVFQPVMTGHFTRLRCQAFVRTRPCNAPEHGAWSMADSARASVCAWNWRNCEEAVVRNEPGVFLAVRNLSANSAVHPHQPSSPSKPLPMWQTHAWEKYVSAHVAHSPTRLHGHEARYHRTA